MSFAATTVSSPQISVNQDSANLITKDEDRNSTEKLNIDELKLENSNAIEDSVTQLRNIPGDQDEGDEDPSFNSNSESHHQANEDSRKCKQQIPRSIETSSVGENEGAEVRILSLTFQFSDREDMVLATPFPPSTSKATLFTLKEGCKYNTKMQFTVSKNTVTGLCNTYMVWKAGIRVHDTKRMMGTFTPRQEPYSFETEQGVPQVDFL